MYLDILFIFLSFELFNTLEIEALEFIFRYLASHPHIQNSNRYIFSTFQLKPSPASRQILKTIWTNTNNDVSLREITFYYWGICINQNDLDSLRIIKSDFPSYESVLWKRALLSDFSIVPDILPLLSKNINWLKVAHHIWCDELINGTKHHLQRLIDKISNDSFSGNTYEIEIICDLLTIIPELDTENILEEYWRYLGYNSRFIQTAIYVGTPKCLSLAKSSIEKCPDNILIFKNCSYNFHLSYDNKQEYLSKDKLERLIQNLLPYIDLCDELDILYLAKACKKFGLIDFSKCLTLKLTDEFRKGVHPSHICHHTENELLEELKKFLSSDDGINELTIWLEHYEMQYELKPIIIRKFILAHPTMQGLKIAARCLELIGNRKDISILDNLQIEAPLDELEKIKSSLQFTVYRRTLD